MKTERSGFSLIELVVAMALLLTFLAMTFGIVGSYYRQLSRQTQEAAIQQNFRFAIDSLTNDMREATSVSHPGAPGNLVMNESVTFHSPSLGDITYHAVTSAAAGVYRIVRTTASEEQTVTEDLPELVKVYFIYSGRKIYVVMVARITVDGQQSLISLVSLVYGRNLGD